MSAWGWVKGAASDVWDATGGQLLGKQVGSRDIPEAPFRLPGYSSQESAANAYRLNKGGSPFRADQQGLVSRLTRQATGKDSYSRALLRDSAQRNMSAQQSMAAGATPTQRTMMARQAMMNTANIGQGMAGQAALADIQERAAANAQLGGVLQGARGQDMQAQIDAMNLQRLLSGQEQMGAIERQRLLTQERVGAMGQPSGIDRLIGGAAAVAPFLAASDERAKKNIADGDTEADSLLARLAPKVYEYKSPESHGGGRRLGVMAQDLERTSLTRSTVQEGPDGVKYVNLEKLVPALAAGLGRLAERTAHLEKKGA